MPLAWAALLVTLVAAGEVDKDACSVSHLQIHSSIHEAGHHHHVKCDGTRSQVTATGSQGQLTLLQVAARTGEVAQYLPSQHDAHDEEGVAPAPASKSKGEHRGHGGIESLLAHGSTSNAGHNDNNDADHGHSKKDDNEHDAGNNDNNNGNNDNNNDNNDDEARDRKSEKPEPKDKGEEKQEVPQGARIAPFGKEDTARELQHHAARTQDTLVDAIENAEVAEIKRSIFRSLTRLRAAEIKEFDTIARLETQAIDEYNDNHHYRSENPLDYIHTSEVSVKEDKYTSFHD